MIRLISAFALLLGLGCNSGEDCISTDCTSDLSQELCATNDEAIYTYSDGTSFSCASSLEDTEFAACTAEAEAYCDDAASNTAGTGTGT